MSQFFNQTQYDRRDEHVSNDRKARIPQLVAADVEEGREVGSQANPSGAPDLLQGLLDELRGESPVAAQLGIARLDQCRKVTIPRTSSKLLFAESELCRSLVAESYRAVRTSLLRFHEKAHTTSLCITSAVAGEGKTLTSMNLALCFSQVPKLRVLVVDADLHTAGLSQLIACQNDPGLAELLTHSATHEEAIAAADVGNLYMLPVGNSRSAPPELFAGTEWKEFVSWAAQCFDIIIVDSPPLLPLADTELILGACDAVVLVSRSLRTPREIIPKAMEKLEGKKLLGTIFNGTEIARPEAHYYYGMK